jgi:NADPH:quinone reductase-like Zn-dependent oxidoreductase
MRALRFERTGALSVLKLDDIPRPIPKMGEVLIHVRAAAINPIDVKNVLGMVHQTTLPRTPGRDFAGEVVDGASRFIGQEVFGTGGDLGFTRDGTHAEYIVVPEEAILPKPKSISLEQAAALGLVYMTAWLALITTAQLAFGETALIVGVTGGVGSSAARIANWKGARVLGTIRQESEKAIVSNLPVDIIINLEKETLPEAVLRATNGRGADVVLDVVGGPMFEKCLQCLAECGRQVAISSTGDPRVSFNLIDFYHREGRLLGVNTLKLTSAESARILEQMIPGIKAGFFKPPDIKTCPLEDAIMAYEKINNGEAKKKFVIVT